ncbi:MAG: DUF3343 domain-containing protein [Clostridia bacterium]|nr:DUF3343 domain-containing protein [Clostridia bacterium]
MSYYYVVVMSKSHAFLLERRLKSQGIKCDLAYMPREIMTDVCNMGVRFHERELNQAADVIRHSGIPGCKLYKEVIKPEGYMYYQASL